MGKSEMYFIFGGMAEKFSKQAEYQGMKLTHPEFFDKLVDSIVLLYVNGILTKSRYNDCLDRVLKKANKDAVSE